MRNKMKTLFRDELVRRQRRAMYRRIRHLLYVVGVVLLSMIVWMLLGVR